MSIDDSFYKNVCLLTEVEPPSYEFRKHFRKRMFERPNTSGFIHVSQYLLNIYDPISFNKFVTWPIMCKTYEKTYRAQVKSYLEVVSNDNPDIRFPPILMSHLLQAGGIKFLIIMWKISQVALRRYLTRECQIPVLPAPKPGQTVDISATYFNNMNMKKIHDIQKYHTEMYLSAQIIDLYIKKKFNDLKNIKNDIFETKERIDKYLQEAPVSPLIAERLVDINDEEIINLWKQNLEYNFKYLTYKTAVLNKLSILSGTVRSIVLSLYGDPTILDANKFSGISIIDRKKQDPICGLYKNDLFVCHDFLLTFNQILIQWIDIFKIQNFPDQSNCQLHINKSYETIKIMETAFQQFLIQLPEVPLNMNCILQEQNLNSTLDRHLLCQINTRINLSSPRITFSFYEERNDKKLSNRLWLSPVKGKHKNLFRRYTRSHLDLSKQAISKLQFNDNIQSNTTNNWMSPQKHSLIYKHSSPDTTRVSPRYSRLFSNTDSKKKYFNGNNAVSTPKQSSCSVTPKRSDIQIRNTKGMDLDVVAKNLFDLTCQVTDAVASLCGTTLKSPRYK